MPFVSAEVVLSGAAKINVSAEAVNEQLSKNAKTTIPLCGIIGYKNLEKHTNAFRF